MLQKHFPRWVNQGFPANLMHTLLYFSEGWYKYGHTIPSESTALNWPWKYHRNWQTRQQAEIVAELDKKWMWGIFNCMDKSFLTGHMCLTGLSSNYIDYFLWIVKIFPDSASFQFLLPQVVYIHKLVERFINSTHDLASFDLPTHLQIFKLEVRFRVAYG